MHNLLQYISTRCFVSSELRQRLNQDFELIQLPAGEVLLKPKYLSGKLYFIEHDLIHTNYYHDDKQVSSWFYPEHQFVTSWYSFYTKKPGFEEIGCLEDYVLHAVNYKNIKN